MTRVRSMQHDDGDDIFWNSKQEWKKSQSDMDCNRELRSTSIKKGIEDYFDRSKLRKDIADSYDEVFDDFEDFDNDEDQSYH